MEIWRGAIAAIATMAAMGALQAQELKAGASFIVIGDPQLHSMSGGYIKQSASYSDAVVKVSRRFPEENLLAEYWLQDLISAATNIPGGKQGDMLILLGDGTNIGCTGEYDRLDARLNEVRRTGRLVLWAHGNHDTYLSGTINNQYPAVASIFNDEDVLDQMMESNVPIDLSWWTAPKSVSNEAAWNNICWDNSGSLPINKGQWMARYAKSIGVTLEGALSTSSNYNLTAKIDPASALGLQNFSIRGKWFPPLSNKYSTENAINRPYLSYLVQGVNIGTEYRLILIDTSVCKTARLTAKLNAGTNACIGEDQFSDISAMVEQTDRKILIGAHFPIRELKENEQRKLISILNGSNRYWSYFSAHTHAPHEGPKGKSRFLSYATQSGEQRYDYNVGSTTDWPMEAHRVFLGSDWDGIVLKKISATGKEKLAYRRGLEAGIAYELCRHVTVAERLAKLDLALPSGETWNGGVLANENLDAISCHGRTIEYAERLRKARAEIDTRMLVPEYRERMMMILRGASWHSKITPTLQDVLDKIVR